MKIPKYTGFGVKDLDTFFCGASFHAFSRCFPQAKGYQLLALRGKSDLQKAAIFQKVSRRLREESRALIRLLKSSCPAQTVGILLPEKHIFALDCDYFAGISEEYPFDTKISFSADAPSFARLSEEEKERLAELNNQIAESKQRAQSFQEAAASLHAENRQQLVPCIDKAAVLRFLFRFLQKKNGRILCREKTGAAVEHREISGMTGWGIQTLYTPFAVRGLETIVLKDNIGAVSETLLNGLAALCMQNGLSVRLFHCGLTGTAEHCIIPALSAAFFTENLSHPFPLRAKETIPASRFVHLPAFAEVLPEVRFNAAAADEMLEEAVFSQLEADELAAAREQIFKPYADEAYLDSVSEQIYRSLLKSNSQFDESHF